MNPPSRIALIDDDRAWRETLADYLQGKGFDVYPAESARRGLDMLNANDIRLAVIDFNLDEMNGLELLRRLRHRARPVTAFMLSNDDDPTLPARALAEGARAFLYKTTRPSLLLRTLTRTLTAAAAEPVVYLPVVVHRTIWLPVPRPARDPRRN
jgi:DNA-binding response OmpR family regulator